MKAKKVIAMLLAATLSVTAFTGCAINKTATVATLDKEDIKLGLVNFMIRYQEAGYDDMYIQYMGEGYWDKTVSGNNTVLETWKKNAIEEAHELYTLKAHQSDYDVEVSDDEKKEIKKAAEKFMKANPSILQSHRLQLSVKTRSKMYSSFSTVFLVWLWVS